MNDHGFSREHWDQAKVEIHQLLADSAKLRGMIPYSELVATLRSVKLEPRVHGYFNFLAKCHLKRTPRVEEC